MAKLNQIIAIEKGIKTRVYGEVGTIHKTLQKPGLFNGFAKTYHPLNLEDGESLPPEQQKVQFDVGNLLTQIATLSTEYFDVTARKDWTNCIASADIEVEGTVLLKDVPVTYLLFLEKQLTDIRTIFDGLPVRDFTEDWIKDDSSGLHKTIETKTHRTKKIQRPLVLYPATPEHAAQTQIITEDVIAGHWHLTKFTAAISKPRKDKLVERIDTLIKAVKQAREAANAVEEDETPEVGKTLFAYLLAP
jgi:hypothetical protein